MSGLLYRLSSSLFDLFRHVQGHISFVKFTILIQSTIIYLFSEPTNFMELSPSWEAASRSGNISRNLKFYYCAHKSPPLVPILSQINPVRTTQSYHSKMHFNIIFQFYF
jgi:hypothetical protein